MVFLFLQAGPAAEVGGPVQKLAAELDSLASRHDGSATPENLAVARRIQEILGSLAGTAAAGGEHSREAWSLIEKTLIRRERNVAMEAALALLSLKGNEPLRVIFGSLAGMDPAVRRITLETIRASARTLSGVHVEVLAALRNEDDVEAACILVDLAASFGTLEAARGLLGKSPAPPAPAPSTGGREETRDGHASLREAIVNALAAQGRPEVIEWLSKAAWEEALKAREASGAQESPKLEKPPQSEHTSRAKLCALCAVAGLKKSEAARPALEGLLSAEDHPVAEAALDSLKAIGAEPSREAVEKLARAGEAKPRLARKAAETMGSFDPDAAVKILLEMSDRPAWEARREAALGLATFPDRDAAFFRTLKLLEDPNREVRAAAFEALRSFRRKEAVEAALELLAPLRAKDPAQVERYLEWASGRRLGRDKAAWDRWWRSAGDSFQFPREKLAKEPVPKDGTRKPEAD